MLALHTVASFAGLAFLMALSPGPNLFYLASRSLCQGTAAGFASLAGVCTAMLLYMLATAAGLSALFEAVPIAYDVVRFAGAAYLLWLAAKALRTRNAPLATSSLPPEPPGTLYRRGFVTCLLNPKIVLMYGSLLPQFIQPETGSVFAQTIELGLVQVAAAASAHSFIILGAARVSSLFGRSPRFARAQKYLLAGFLAAVAARIAFDRRNAI